MKTKNNVQKTIFKTQLAVIVILVLSGISANAQTTVNAIQKNNNHYRNVMALAVKTVSINTGKVTLGTSNNEAEAPLDLENWMTSREFFRTEKLVFETEKEAPLELEHWMTDSSTFEIVKIGFEIEKESALEFENWMVNGNFESNFKNETETKQIQEKEKALDVENWMIANNYWK
jgi:hypothetical protein